MHTDASIKHMLSKLAEYKDTFTQNQFNEIEIRYGHNYNPYSFLADRQLDVGLTSTLMFDWMHTYLMGGLLDEEVGLLMAALHAANSPTTYQILGDYVAKWTWPKHLHQKSLHFSAGRARKLASKANPLVVRPRNFCVYLGYSADISRRLR